MIDPACHRPHVREDTPDDGRCGVTGGVCTAGARGVGECGNAANLKLLWKIKLINLRNCKVT